jgi:hydrogenase maturation protease
MPETNSIPDTHPMPKTKQHIGILCIGNILMRDEGLGPRLAAELLERFTFPPNVEILDRGTMGMALISDIRRFEVLLVVDAVDKTGHEPGTVLHFGPEDIAPCEAFHGAHDTRLIDVLQACALLGDPDSSPGPRSGPDSSPAPGPDRRPVPETQCLGVQVLDMNPPEFSIGLTPPVEAALPLLIQSVLDFLEMHDSKPLRLVEPTKCP